MHPEQSAMGVVERYHSSYLRAVMDVEASVAALLSQLAGRLDLWLGEEVGYIDNDCQNEVQHGYERGVNSK